MVGMHGSKYANMTLNQSDLIICCGARFSDRVTGKLDGFAPDAKVIHIDIDPAEIGKNREVSDSYRGRFERRFGSYGCLVLQDDRRARFQRMGSHGSLSWRDRFPLYDAGVGDNPAEIVPEIAMRQLSDALDPYEQHRGNRGWPASDVGRSDD